jgi:hypothetical protein
MKPDAKLHLKSGLYCALLAGLNWSNFIEYSGKLGLTRVELSPAMLALLFSVVTAFYLAYRCMKAARVRLERGEGVKKGKWIQNGAVVIYTLPLLFGRQWTSTWTEPDGTPALARRGYGHAWSAWIFVFAVAGLLAFQILSRLSDRREEPNKAPLRTPVSVAGL